MFDTILQQITPWYWLVIGAVLTLCDVLLGSFFFLWIGVSAIVVGVLSWLWPQPGLSTNTQLLIFAMLSCFSLLLFRKYRLKHNYRTEKVSTMVNLRTQQYVGKHFPVFEPILNGRGKIKIGDTTWLVDGEDCPGGTIVTVTGGDGTVLKVKKYHEADASVISKL